MGMKVDKIDPDKYGAHGWHYNYLWTYLWHIFRRFHGLPWPPNGSQNVSGSCHL